MSMALEPIEKEVEKHQKEGEELAAGIEELNQQQQTRERMAKHPNTPLHVASAKAIMFHQRIQKVLRVYMGSKSR